MVTLRMAWVVLLGLFCMAAAAQKDTSGTWPNGQLRFEGKLKKGARTGVWRWYFNDGTLKKEERYAQGLRQGMSYELRPASEAIKLNEDSETLYHPLVVKRYQNDTVRMEIHGYGGNGDTLKTYLMERTSKQKRITRRFMNGRIEAIEEYNAKGQEHGTHQRWNEEGQMLYDYYYENGTLTGAYRQWYTNGTLKAQRAPESNISVRFYPSGIVEQVTHHGTDCGGEECFTRYYESGRKKEEKILIGKVLRETTWKSDQTVEQRELDGTYERKTGWYPTGSLWYSAVYFNGNGTIRWWGKNGLPEQVQHYNNGQRTGTWQYFDANGNLLREEMYENGTQVDTRNY